jgi:hypothetical protein
VRVSVNLFFAAVAAVLLYSGVVTAAEPAQAVKLAVPAQHAYTGAYIDFGENEDDVTLEAIEKFDGLVGKQQAVIGFSSDWGKQQFPERQLKLVRGYGAVPLVYWLPWDRPGETPVTGNRFDLHKIVAGEWDAYIELWAKSAAEYHDPILVAWGLEMNGDWFPWSGVFFGGGNPVEGGTGFAGPELFKAAYRHVVAKVRAAGAANVIWVFHANNTSDPDQPWNKIADYYPGDDVVDWLALSAYGQQYHNAGWVTFDQAFLRAYADLRASIRQSR